MRRLVGALVVLAVLAAGAPAPAETRELTGVENGYRALLFVPDHYTDEQHWPLLLYLHGAAERGDDIQRAATSGPPKEIRGGRALPLIVVAPLLPAGETWDAGRLGALLDAVLAKERVDSGRVYVSGKSLGGSGAWTLVAAAPGRFAALVPVSAAADPSTACASKAVPVWAFHNRDDPVVAVARDEAGVAALRHCGGTARLTVFPARGHDAWTAAYAKPELYEWLLAQHRARQPWYPESGR